MDQEPSPGPSQTQTKEITSFATLYLLLLLGRELMLMKLDLINEEGLKRRLELFKARLLLVTTNICVLLTFFHIRYALKVS